MYKHIFKKKKQNIFKQSSEELELVEPTYPVEVEQKAGGDWQGPAGDSAQRNQTEDEEDLSEKMKSATVTRDWRPAEQKCHNSVQIQVYTH